MFALDQFPRPGAKTRAKDFVSAVGGCAANAAVAIARLAGRVKLAAPLGGPLGVDSIGDEILAHLAREGVDCSSVTRVSGAVSSISAIFIDASGERLIVNHRDSKLTQARAANPDALVHNIGIVLIDNRFPEFVLPIAQAARRRGLAVVLDADEPTQRTNALLSACSHVIFSAEGLRAIGECDELAEALKRVAWRTDAFLVVTDGAHDMLWLETDRLRRLPAFRIHAVDTLAAGDVFHGAFALALGEGSDVANAMRFAAAAAALKCARFGGISGAPSRAEVENFLVAREGGKVSC
ncbi:MAG: PfkB family carbohydrate kinase [Pseudomonadota bacterium]|nr:PfkB family carbohydrate kinase [Pseudomonadota bacterium]